MGGIRMIQKEELSFEVIKEIGSDRQLLRVTHIPSGIIVEKYGLNQFEMKEEALKELKEKIIEHYKL